MSVCPRCKKHKNSFPVKDHMFIQWDGDTPGQEWRITLSKKQYAILKSKEYKKAVICLD